MRRGEGQPPPANDAGRSSPELPRATRSHMPDAVWNGIEHAETAIYLVIGVLLVAAGLLTVVGTFVDGIGDFGEKAAVDIGVLVLDRILLIFIITELLFTLRLTVYRGQILAEPFLFIGLIAVVRRVLVITAESEGVLAGGRTLTNFLLELGALSVLALALAIAIYLLRRSADRTPRQAPQAPGSPAT